MWKVWLVVLLLILAPIAAAQITGSPCAIERAAAAGEHVWLLCQRDEMFVSSDQGKTWQSKRLPAEMRFRAMAVLDGKRGFVAGDNGALLMTTDGGNTWQPIAVPAKENLTSIHFVGDKGWISGWSGVILHSSDGGKTWVRQQTGILLALESVYFTDPQHGWAVGWMGTILRTTDGGQTWEKARTQRSSWSLNSVYFRDPNNGWAVGFNGQILRSRDGGVTWEEVNSPIQSWLTSILFDSAGRGWITADNQLLLSKDGGETWTVVPIEGTVFLQQLLQLKDSFWAVGRFGVLEQDGSTPGFRALATLPRVGGSSSGSTGS
jgi:photosystem II stability/assembly factor-like uncharacterized protein